MKIQVWQSALLAKIPGVVHGVSTRLGGVSRPPFATLNCSLQTGDRVEDVIENRRRLLTWLGFGLDAAVWGEQVHGAVVRRVTRRDATTEEGAHARGFPGTDGLVTTQQGLALMAFFADCLPIIAAEEGGRAAGVAHAGWRGTIAGVARQLIASLRECGVAPERIKVALGPCIKPCCYAVSEELYQRFRDEIGPQAVGGPARAGPPWIWREPTRPFSSRPGCRKAPSKSLLFVRLAGRIFFSATGQSAATPVALQPSSASFEREGDRSALLVP